MKIAIKISSIVLGALLLCGCEEKKKINETNPIWEKETIESTGSSNENTEISIIESEAIETTESGSCETVWIEKETMVTKPEQEEPYQTAPPSVGPNETQSDEEATTEPTGGEKQEGSMGPEDEF